MKSDHQGLADEIEKLNGQVGKGKQALDTKQSEENELRSELVVRHFKPFLFSSNFILLGT